MHAAKLRFAVVVAGVALAAAACLPPRAPDPPPTTTTTPRVMTRGFDACTAPSSLTMSAWKASSPYVNLGVYIGGALRACSQGNLTPSWVTTVTGQGWHLIPIYVGIQAPCTSFRLTIDPTQAAAQGAAAADDAANIARNLQLSGSVPVYLDMEAYDYTNTTCSTAVRTFVSAWVGELHAKGLSAGFYSSSASGIKDQALMYNNSSYNRLDAIWFANWDNRVAVFGDPFFADTLWPNHQRLHQYQGGHNETYGGVTINIDSDAVDGPTYPS